MKEDGSLWSWGFDEGRLGNNEDVDRSSPVQVGVDKEWSGISSGNQQSYAFKNFVNVRISANIVP